MRALSIRQPWAWLIIHGGKDVENRTWKTNYRGSVLIHTGKTLDNIAHKELFTDISLDVWPPFRRGGIVGIADIVGCVTDSDSPWFTGPYGFVLENARRLPFTPMKGRLGLFEVEWPEVIDR